MGSIHHCTTCQMALNIPPGAEGRWFICPGCKQSFEVKTTAKEVTVSPNWFEVSPINENSQLTQSPDWPPPVRALVATAPAESPADVEAMSIAKFDLEMAQIVLQNARNAWEKYQFERVDPAAVANQRLAAENVAKALQQAEERFDSLRNESGKLELRKVRLRRRLLFLQWWENRYAPIVLAFAFVLSGVALGVFVALVLSAALGWLIGIVMISIAGLVVAAWFSTSEGITADSIKSTAEALGQAESEYSLAAARLTAAHQVKDSIGTKFQATKEALDRMGQLSNCARDYEVAKAHCQRLLDIVNSEKYKLLHSNWRELRSVEFEQFLKRVFERLGYAVEITKASGDKGLDLVVTGNAKKIGVQVKGYTGTVGFDAIKEAVTGRLLYKCDCCAVITNSSFTRQAEETARALDCKLIRAFGKNEIMLS
jgi:Restriction endonuclease